jgi:hypothetical protein
VPLFLQLGTAIRHCPPLVQVPGRVASSPYGAAPPINGSHSFVPVPNIVGRHLEAFHGPPPLSPCRRVRHSTAAGSGVSLPLCRSFPDELLCHNRAVLAPQRRAPGRAPPSAVPHRALGRMATVATRHALPDPSCTLL